MKRVNQPPAGPVQVKLTEAYVKEGHGLVLAGELVRGAAVRVGRHLRFRVGSTDYDLPILGITPRDESGERGETIRWVWMWVAATPAQTQALRAGDLRGGVEAHVAKGPRPHEATGTGADTGS